ncbi:hypothetical protein AA313_de0201184 [Arthrobotrys entomopaga]|nr:hypothetical protein AA313_de0201184 [Arthrobotrys entomopaga]
MPYINIDIDISTLEPSNIPYFGSIHPHHTTHSIDRRPINLIFDSPADVWLFSSGPSRQNTGRFRGFARNLRPDLIESPTPPTAAPYIFNIPVQMRGPRRTCWQLNSNSH